MWRNLSGILYKNKAAKANKQQRKIKFEYISLGLEFQILKLLRKATLSVPITPIDEVLSTHKKNLDFFILITTHFNRSFLNNTENCVQKYNKMKYNYTNSR